MVQILKEGENVKVLEELNIRINEDYYKRDISDIGKKDEIFTLMRRLDDGTRNNISLGRDDIKNLLLIFSCCMRGERYRDKKVEFEFIKKTLNQKNGM